METSEDRERLARTFDRAADRYHRARPDYPSELFDQLLSWAALDRDAELLEVGCATGKATVPLAERGCRITCIELGEDLVAAARANLAGFPAVTVLVGRFEDCPSLMTSSFDLVYAATAWHWIDPAVRYRRAWELLRPGGHLAIWSASHVFPDGGDPFFREIQEIYEEIGEGLPPDAVWLRPGELDDHRAEIEASGLFDDVQTRPFDWEVVYDADGYLELLSTFSGHLEMAAWQRDRLFGEIRRRLAERPDGLLRRHWGVALTVARRRGTVGFLPSSPP